MERSCDVCGKKYVAKTAKSLFCSAACRQKAARQRSQNAPIDLATKRNAPPRKRNGERNAPRKAQAVPVAPPAAPRVGRMGPLEQSTRAQLDAVGMAETMLGAAAINMARLLDVGNMTGSAYAALNREWRSTAAIALSEGKAAEDPLDQLARRRIDRRAGA